MEGMLHEIQVAYKNGLYRLALFSVLTLPDICGALRSSDGEADSKKYTDWYEEFVLSKYPVLSATEAYQYRCSALHQGKSEPRRSENKDYERIIFLDPSAKNRITVKRISVTDPNTGEKKSAIAIDLESLIHAILSGVDESLQIAKGTKPFDDNYKNFMQLYPQGISPWIGGASVIG